MQSTKKTFRHLTKDSLSNLRTTIIGISIGALAALAVSAPFLHIVFPSPEYYKEKKFIEKQLNENKISSETYIDKNKLLEKKYEFLGYSNRYKFLYAIGNPLSMLIMAILFSISLYIESELFKKSIKPLAFVYFYVCVYQISWTIFSKNDFPKGWYYTSIIIISLICTYFFYLSFNRVIKYSKRISRVKKSIPDIKQDINIIRGLTSIMPEDEDNITRKATFDVVSDKLKRSVEKVETSIHGE